MSKLTDKEFNTIKREQIALAYNLQSQNIGYYSRQHSIQASILQNEGADSEEEESAMQAQKSAANAETKTDEVEVNHAEMIKMLMLSKDDNLLL